jgi:hypothetical protein
MIESLPTFLVGRFVGDATEELHFAEADQAAVVADLALPEIGAVVVRKDRELHVPHIYGPTGHEQVLTTVRAMAWCDRARPTPAITASKTEAGDSRGGGVDCW